MFIHYTCFIHCMSTVSIMLNSCCILATVQAIILYFLLYFVLFLFVDSFNIYYTEACRDQVWAVIASHVIRLPSYSYAGDVESLTCLSAFYLVLLASHNPPGSYNTQPGRGKNSRGGGVGIAELVSVHLMYMQYYNMGSITYFRAIKCDKMILIIHSENIFCGGITCPCRNEFKIQGLTEISFILCYINTVFTRKWNWIQTAQLLWGQRLIQTTVTVDLLPSSSSVPKRVTP